MRGGLHGIDLSISPSGWFVLNHPLCYIPECMKLIKMPHKQ